MIQIVAILRLYWLLLPLKYSYNIIWILLYLYSYNYLKAWSFNHFIWRMTFGDKKWLDVKMSSSLIISWLIWIWQITSFSTVLSLIWKKVTASLTIFNRYSAYILNKWPERIILKSMQCHKIDPDELLDTINHLKIKQQQIQTTEWWKRYSCPLLTIVLTVEATMEISVDLPQKVKVHSYKIQQFHSFG